MPVERVPLKAIDQGDGHICISGGGGNSCFSDGMARFHNDAVIKAPFTIHRIYLVETSVRIGSYPKRKSEQKLTIQARG